MEVTSHYQKHTTSVDDQHVVFRHASVSSTYPSPSLRLLVRPLVRPLVTLSDFQSMVSNGRSNQKIQTTKSIYSRFLLPGGPSPPSQLVPNPFNWSPKTVYRNPSIGRSNKKISKNKVHLFSNFVSGRTLLTHKNLYEGLNAQKYI